MKYNKTLIIFICLIISYLLLPGQTVFAVPEQSRISNADTFIDLTDQQVLITEQYEFTLLTARSKLHFEFPVLENQPTSILQNVMLSDNSNESSENALFFIAEERTESDLDGIGNFFYEISLSEGNDLLNVDVYYDFVPGNDYTLAFNFEQNALLKISQDIAFLEYPISVPDFIDTADKYSVHYNLPRELLPEDYRMQTVTETWLEDKTKDFSDLTFTSYNFRYQDGQYIYISFPADIFPDLEVSHPDLTMSDFFPNPDTIVVKQESILDFVENTWFLTGIIIFSIVGALLLFIIFELEGYLFIQKLEVDKSIFDLDAAHSAYLLNSDEKGNLILAGLLQLVQKNEIDLHKTTFSWKYPEREDFSEFSSSEIFLLQWLFDATGSSRNYFVTSAEKIYAMTGDVALAKDYLLNFRKYIALLEDDLENKNFINHKNKVKGKNAYITFSILLAFLFIVVFVLSKSIVGLIILLPLAFMIHRIFKARYFTVEGREKLRQIKALKQKLQSVQSFLADNAKDINPRDMAPLILPYAIGFSIAESFLDQLDSGSFSRLGVLDLLEEQIDFSSVSENILDEEWLYAKTDLLRMYYLFIASIVNAQISMQQEQIIHDQRDQIELS